MKKLLFFLLPLLLLASVPAQATDFYWVNGSGDWSDIDHWRMGSSTGAIPLQAPSQNDNAYFDANSGFTATDKTVTISGSVTCRDIKFDGCVVAPTVGFSTVGATLNIYGSSVWQAGMSLIMVSPSTGGALVYQDTGTPKTITTNDATLWYVSITINETSSVSLQGNLIASGTCSVTINAGTFNTNDFRIGNLYSVTANSATAKTLNLGSSDITCGLFYTNNASTTVHAGTSTIHYAGTGYLTGITGQQFNNVIFEAATGAGNVSGGVNINHLEFRGTGAINQNNTIGDLILAAGKTYSFAYGTTQTITNSITGSADCAWITLKSSDLNQTADPIISVDAGASVNLTGIIINGVNANGTGAPVTLNNSVDGLGDATGWDYTGTLPAQDLYWVGGAGNWSDIAHWSFTSGGTGGDCVPGPGNNVFFDANSGFTTASKTVTIDGTSYCHDITFDGATTPPSLVQSGAQTLNIYGSSVLQAGMTVGAINNISYQNTGEDKTITSNGVTTFVNINIYETASVSLTDDFNGGTGQFHLYAGTFNTNDHDVTNVSQFQSHATQLKLVTLNLGSSTLTVGGFLSNNAYTDINAGTSHIHVTGANGLQGYAGQHFYDVTLSNAICALYTNGSTAANPTYFNRVEILNGANLNGFLNINSLTLAPGFTYKLNVNSTNTLTVNESFTAGQDCAVLTVIDGNNNNTLSMPASATVNVHNVILQKSKTTGGADFTANNSVDNNGNSGWNFTSAASPALYWVGGAGDWNDAAHWSLSSGGAGGACVPGMGSDVFFDAGSGFTDASKTVSVAAGENSYCRNVTVDGSPIAPTFMVGGSLNIYGSSAWQAGMTMNGGTINYQNTGTPKTITSNGVVMSSSVNFNETTSVSLADDLSVTRDLKINAGTFNTNNHNLTQPNFYIGDGIATVVFNAGSSVVSVNGFTAKNHSIINLDSSQWTVTVNNYTVTIENGVTVIPGESTIAMTGTNMAFQSFGQPFHNVIFNNSGTIKNNSTTQDQTFNSVVMKKGGTLGGNNTYGSLYLMGVSTGNAVYNLDALKTQTVTGELVMMGTTCGQVQVISSTTQTKANLNVTGGDTHYNWVDMSDINATGSTIYLGTQGTSNRNENVNYDNSGPIEFSPFPDWTCHGLVAGDADSYIIKSDGFYGNSYSRYVWTDSLSNVIGTGSTLDILSLGNGTYTLTVTYYNAAGFNKADSICENTASIVVYKTPPVSATYADPANPLLICMKQGKATVAEGKASIHGQAVEWYDKNGVLMDKADVLVDGEMYQITQTMESPSTGIDCESFKVNVYVKLVNCNNVYVNPGGRMRVMMK